MKRLVDLLGAVTGLLLTSPLIVLAAIGIWLEDRHSPIYLAPRVGLRGRPFTMIKLRSMRVGADQTKVDSTSDDDARITRAGRWVRAYKLDELLQLCNVFTGDMSLVGPRPNILREVELYTEMERQLLDVRPGITDLSSIVFADLGNILRDAEDANIKYNQYVRPWKSRLGLFYVQHTNWMLDIRIIWLTLVSFVARETALRGVASILAESGADAELVELAARQSPLQPAPPPGASSIVTRRGR